MLCAVPAMGQGSQSECRWVGSTWTCDTKQKPDIWGDFNRNLERQRLDQERMRRDSEAAAVARSQRQEQSAMTEIWIRCRQRWNEALEARDFELANALVKGCPAAPE